eukprot:6941074-Pyramimonas_sp.AAC.1
MFARVASRARPPPEATWARNRGRRRAAAAWGSAQTSSVAGATGEELHARAAPRAPASRAAAPSASTDAAGNIRWT